MLQLCLSRYLPSPGHSKSYACVVGSQRVGSSGVVGFGSGVVGSGVVGSGVVGSGVVGSGVVGLGVVGSGVVGSGVVGSGVVGSGVGTGVGESGHSGTFSGQSHTCSRSLNHSPSGQGMWNTLPA